MPHSYRRTLRQRTPDSNSKQFFYDSDLYKQNRFNKEIFLDSEQWQNIAENRLPWYEYNHSLEDKKKNTAIQHMILPCIRDIITFGLTPRQR